MWGINSGIDNQQSDVWRHQPWSLVDLMFFSTEPHRFLNDDLSVIDLCVVS